MVTLQQWEDLHERKLKDCAAGKHFQRRNSAGGLNALCYYCGVDVELEKIKTHESA